MYLFFCRPRAIKSQQCRRTNVAYNFGKPRVIDAVPVFCMAYGPSDVCCKCGTVCEGDYWKLDNSVLCHHCWVESRVFADEYTSKLKNYQVCIEIRLYFQKDIPTHKKKTCKL